MSTTDPTPSNLRDLAADLSAEQVKRLTRMEQKWRDSAPAAELAELLVEQARQCIEERLLDSAMAHVPTPDFVKATALSRLQSTAASTATVA